MFLSKIYATIWRKNLEYQSREGGKQHVEKPKKTAQADRQAEGPDPKTFQIYTTLRVLVIVSMILCIVQGQYENAALCLLSLILFLLPAFFENQLKIEIPPLFERIIYLFIFAAEILGEVNRFYTQIPGWDTMLHTMNGFLCAVIGFAMVDLLNRHSEHFNLTPLYLAFTAFCFSMTIGVMWEFIEFFGDQFFGLDMQKDYIVQSISSVRLDPTHSQIPHTVNHISETIIKTADGKQVVIKGGYLDIGIIDTMKDLLVNFIGAVISSVLGYIYVKTRDAKNIVGKLMIHPQTEEAEQEIDAYLDEQEKERIAKREEKKHRISRR